MKIIIFYKYFFILLGCSLLVSACSKKTFYLNRSEVVFLEINSDLSVVSEYSQHFQNGVKLALDEVNKLGGINGKRVTVIHSNDYINYLDAKRAVVSYKDSNVLAAFGTYFSSAADGASSGAAVAKIPFLSSGYSGSIIYEKPNEYTYSLRPSLYSQLKALALEASSLENLNRWLIITYSNEEGIKASKYFTKQLMLLHSKKHTSSTDNKYVDNGSSKLAFKFYYIYTAPFKASALVTNSKLSSILKEVKGVLIITNGKDLQYLLEKNQLKNMLSSKVVLVPFAGDPEWLSYFNEELTPEHWIVTGYPWYALHNTSHTDFYNKYYNMYKLQPRYASILGYLSLYMLVNCAKHVNLDIPNIYYLREQFNKKLSSLVLYNPDILGRIYIRKDHFSSLGVYTGNLKIFSQKIISDKGTKMQLKDIRMNNIKYYNHTVVNLPEHQGEKIRNINFKLMESKAKALNKNIGKISLK